MIGANVQTPDGGDSSSPNSSSGGDTSISNKPSGNWLSTPDFNTSKYTLMDILTWHTSQNLNYNKTGKNWFQRLYNRGPSPSSIVSKTTNFSTVPFRVLSGQVPKLTKL